MSDVKLPFGAADLHKFAKQVICDELKLRLPDDLGVMRSATQGDQPDVMAEYDSEQVAVEIYITRRLPAATKIEEIAKHRLATVEIDLSYHREVEASADAWRDIVIAGAGRRWLYPPKRVRDQIEREAAERLALAREAAREAVRLEEAEQMTLHARRQELAAFEKLRAAEASEIAARQGQASAEVLRAIKRRRAAEAQKAADLTRKIADAEERAGRLKYESGQAKKASAEQERCSKEAVLYQSLERLHEAERAPPSLEELVLAHGNYDRITPGAWARRDAEMASWKQAVRVGLKRQGT